MEYAADIFIDSNRESYFRLYAGQPEGQFAFFHYEVGDLVVTASNLANDRGAYRQELEFRLNKLHEVSLVELAPGIKIPDWSETDREFINFGAFVSVLKDMPEEQLSAFKPSLIPVIPSNPWERGEAGFDVHFSFDRQIDATLLSFSTLYDALMYDSYEVKKYGVQPVRCQNCGKLFFPHSRSDEIYCKNIFKNGKTCKELGYEMKVRADKIMNEYRRIYKMQNARKQRNQQKRNIAARFDSWTEFAKQVLKQCQNGEITLEEMKSKISSADWMT